MAVAPVVTMSSTTSTAPRPSLDDLDPSGDVALPVGAGQADGVADQRPQPQRLNDVDTVQPRRCHPRDPGHGVAAAAPGG